MGKYNFIRSPSSERQTSAFVRLLVHFPPRCGCLAPWEANLQTYSNRAIHSQSIYSLNLCMSMIEACVNCS